MKILEVSTLQSGMDTVEKDLHVQKKQLQQIEQSIQAFVDLRDSFKGLGGQSIRQFFEWYHLSFLKQLLSFYEEYKETLSQIKTNLQALEPDNNGYIKESFLENELANGLKKIKETTIFLTDEANDIMLGVADIVSLPMLDDSYVLQGIVKAEEKRDITVGQLHMFDQQQTTALQFLQYTVQAMINYIQLGSTLFQSKSGSVQTVDSIIYNQAAYQPPLPLYTYSSATLNQLSMWDNFYLNYVKSNPISKVEALMSVREADALMRHAKDSVEVIDEYIDINEVSAISRHYYTLGDGKILRQYYNATGAYKYEYVESIPEDQIGETKEVGSEVVSFILDFIPILSNIKAAIEAFSGKDFITGREIGDVERAVLAAAIFGGPIVKGAKLVGTTAMKQLSKVKNVFHPDKAKSLAKGFYDDYIQKGIAKGTSVFKDLVKKVADIPMPSLSPSLVTTNGMDFTKTIGETMKEAKETIVQMAGKVKESVSGKGNGENDNYFIGTLKGEKVHLKGVKVEEIIYTKRLPEETAELRKEFNSSIRKKFLKEFANDPVRVIYLRKASLGEDDIARMKGGLNPKGWQVHHNLPLDDGGTNDFTNLVLIKNDPYHKAVTNEQLSLTRGLAPKQSKTINWPMFEDDVYPAKPFKRRED